VEATKIYTTKLENRISYNFDHACIQILLPTSEKVIFQTAPWHIFIHKQPLIIFDAISNEFDQICMAKLTEEVDFCLQNNKKNICSGSLNLNPSVNHRTDIK
jgi:hypothetical protein